MEDYNKAIDLDSSYSMTYNNRGELRRVTGDLNGALEDFNMAI